MELENEENVMLGAVPPAPMLVVRNEIFLYDEITTASARALIQALYQAAMDMVNNIIEGGYNPAPIKIHINSNGGSVSDALAIVNCIEKIKSGEAMAIGNVKIPIEVYTYIEGEADSSASLIACVGSKRFVSKYALSLIHPIRQTSNGSADKIEDVQVQAKNLEKFQNIFNEIYLSHSKLNKKELAKLISNEEYSTPQDLIKFGLVDEII